MISNQPGWKRPAPEPESHDESANRARVLAEIERAPGSSEQIAERTGIDLLSVRPRCSDLENEGLIRDSGERHPTATGQQAIVWRSNPR